MSVLPATLLVVGCGRVPDVARDPAPMLQTTDLRYRIERHDIGYSASIPYTFRNRTGAPVELAHCDGDVRPLLQVRRGDRWIDAWQPLMRTCTAPPVVVPMGAVYEDTLRVVGAPPGSNVSPAFVFEDVEGVYRLYWFQAARVTDESGPTDPPSARDEPDWRASNPFVLAFR